MTDPRTIAPTEDPVCGIVDPSAVTMSGRRRQRLRDVQTGA